MPQAVWPLGFRRYNNNLQEVSGMPLTIDEAMQMALGHHQAGRLAEAETLYRLALEQYPEHAGALHLLGVLACQAGRLDDAVDLIGRAIAVEPGVAAYHSNRAEVCRRAGRWDDAIAGFQRAIALDGNVAQTHANLAGALWGAGRLDEAIAAARQAIALEPDCSDAYANLGNALKDQRRFDEAIAALERAVAIRPDFALAYNNLGCALIERGDPEAAAAVLGRAIALAPEMAEAHSNLGNALKDTGRLDEAVACYRRALALKPDLAMAASCLLYALHFQPEHDAGTILAEHCAWARQFADPLAGAIRPHQNDRTPNRRLRVGFVSPDFRSHALGRSLLPLFAHHDRRQAAFIAYADVRAPDAITGTLRGLADEWHVVTGLSDSVLADRIRGDRIDILVDLALHTAGNRLMVFARKPAPVQVTMLGLPATTGLAAIDYRLTDPYLDPPGTGDADYQEQSIRLRHCFWCYQPPEDAPPPGALPALAGGFVTFGCLNQFVKVSRPALEAWVKILQAVPGARVLIHAPVGRHRDRTLQQFQEGGIDSERVAFAGRLPRAEYLARYGEIDLALDPFPYNGGITTMDSLWMGVPVITLMGRAAVGRAGVSILSNVGLPGLIARTIDEYVAIARDWAGDTARLAAVRAGLRDRMRSSPLLDGPQYAASVDAALRGMWQTWCGR
jgi:predicted O-linked N-acetylglucosamine transferase (SPINDLY family)